MATAIIDGIVPVVGQLRFASDFVNRLYYGATQVWPPALSVSASPGAYLIAGKPVALRKATIFSAAPGAYLVAGEPASFKRSMVVEPAPYAIAGVSASLTATRRLGVDPGIYAIVGQQADLRAPRLAAAVGGYSLQGQPVNLRKAHIVATATGIYILSGINAGLSKTLAMPAAIGPYALTGIGAAFLRGLSILASPGSFTLAGAAAGGIMTRKMAADSGAYTYAGVNAGTLRGLSVLAVPGAYALSGKAADLAYAGGGPDAFTKLLLHMDGSNGSTTFTDSSAAARTVTRVGATISTTQSKFGGASGVFTAATHELSIADHVDLRMGTGDFTIDFWAYIANNAAVVLFSKGEADASDILLETENNTVNVYVGGYVNTTSAYSPNTWVHHALVRNGTTLRYYLNGAQVISETNTANINNSSSPVLIGRAGTSATRYLDEYRISKGIARWTAGFTPPSAAY